MPGGLIVFHVKHPTSEAFGVSRETTDRLVAYAELLLRWNRTINLISKNDEPVIWTRHIQDALALIPHLPPTRDSAPEPDNAIDIGSGAGLPGLILAIATNRRFTLVESDQRKAAFLREAARATGANVVIHAARIEQLTIASTPLVTARAVAPLIILLGWAVPVLAPGGICLFPKGRTAKDELTAAASQWHMRVETFASPTDPEGTILKISEISRVGHRN